MTRATHSLDLPMETLLGILELYCDPHDWHAATTVCKTLGDAAHEYLYTLATLTERAKLEQFLRAPARNSRGRVVRPTEQHGRETIIKVRTNTRTVRSFRSYNNSRSHDPPRSLPKIGTSLPLRLCHNALPHVCVPLHPASDPPHEHLDISAHSDDHLHFVRAGLRVEHFGYAGLKGVARTFEVVRDGEARGPARRRRDAEMDEKREPAG